MAFDQHLHRLFILPLVATLLARVSGSHITTGTSDSDMHSFPCSDKIHTCSASLYHINNSIPQEKVALYYSANSSQMKPISHGNAQDYLITVPCTCKTVNGTTGYFYNTSYTVEPNDIFVEVSAEVYSGQAWRTKEEEQYFIAGDVVPIYLLCGCVGSESQIVVTYTVQPQDTLTSIATLLSARISGIKSMNTMVAHNPDYIEVGWILFVPMELNGIPPPKKGD